MQKEDWRRIAKMIGYVYLPIVLLIIGIFILIQYQSAQIEKEQQPIQPEMPLIVPEETEKLPQ